MCVELRPIRMFWRRRTQGGAPVNTGRVLLLDWQLLPATRCGTAGSPYSMYCDSTEPIARRQATELSRRSGRTASYVTGDLPRQAIRIALSTNPRIAPPTISTRSDAIDACAIEEASRQSRSVDAVLRVTDVVGSADCPNSSIGRSDTDVVGGDSLVPLCGTLHREVSSSGKSSPLFPFGAARFRAPCPCRVGATQCVGPPLPVRAERQAAAI